LQKVLSGRAFAVIQWKRDFSGIPDSSYLPKIDSQDPMAKWIGARPSDVIEVLGLCESSGLNRRYRLCLADVANA
jgi:hypothetical protein